MMLHKTLQICTFAIMEQNDLLSGSARAPVLYGYADGLPDRSGTCHELRSYAYLQEDLRIFSSVFEDKNRARLVCK